jgi:hypothetical protein
MDKKADSYQNTCNQATDEGVTSRASVSFHDVMRLSLSQAEDAVEALNARVREKVYERDHHARMVGNLQSEVDTLISEYNRAVRHLKEMTDCVKAAK